MLLEQKQVIQLFDKHENASVHLLNFPVGVWKTLFNLLHMKPNKLACDYCLCLRIIDKVDPDVCLLTLSKFPETSWVIPRPFTSYDQFTVHRTKQLGIDFADSYHTKGDSIFSRWFMVFQHLMGPLSAKPRN